jgi:predicted Holliday junction resolvase-like endonuclease
MFSAIQILLMVVVLVLTALSVFLGFQVFGLIKQLRQTAKTFQLFLKKKNQDNFFTESSFDSDQEQSKKAKEKDAKPPVSVGLSSRVKSDSSSRSFYRNGRNLS